MTLVRSLACALRAVLRRSLRAFWQSFQAYFENCCGSLGLGFAFALVFLTANLKASGTSLSYARLCVLREFVCLAEGLPCGVALLL